MVILLQWIIDSYQKIWFIIQNVDPWIHGKAAGAAARAAAGSAATVSTYYVIIGGA